MLLYGPAGKTNMLMLDWLKWVSGRYPRGTAAKIVSPKAVTGISARYVVLGDHVGGYGQIVQRVEKLFGLGPGPECEPLEGLQLRLFVPV